MYIERAITGKILEVQAYYPVTLITGPRQSGKSELCKHIFPDYKLVNLENLTQRAYASSDPEGFIKSLGDKAVIDEVQNVPELLSVIQVAVDEDKKRRFILTGSNNFKLSASVTQSLAGRVAEFTLLPFSNQELDKKKLYEIDTDTLLFRGQYPGVIADHITPLVFYTNYLSTYIERDIRGVLKIQNLLKFETFLKLLAARTGSEFNASAISKEVGLSSTTISEWLGLLMASYIVYPVKPFYSNINKRLTKMPKIYFYDTGLLAHLLGIEAEGQVSRLPYKGILFENMAIGEIIKSRTNQGLKPDINFYREHSGKEVDIMKPSGDGWWLYEIKSSSTFNQDYLKNMVYVSSLIEDVKSMEVIYDGETIGDKLINIRDL